MIVDAGLPDLVRIPLSILHGVDLLQDGGNTHSILRVSSPEAAPTGILARNLAAGSVFQRIEYLLHVYRLPASYLWRESNGSVLATRSALTGSNRPVPRPRTAAQETVVRRAVAPAHARALRGNLDRRKRARLPALRTGPLSGRLLPGDRRLSTHSRTHGPHHPTPRSRAHVLVQRPGGRARRAARGVAAHRPARPRQRIAGTPRVRLAGHGRFLRRRRTNRGPCR